jgi:hypothetical protein
VTAKRIGVAVAAALVVPFLITGLFRVGLPGPTPFVVVIVVAAVCWFRGIGLWVSASQWEATVWAVALAVILNSMG